MSGSASQTRLGFIKLEIPTPVPEPPTGEGWIHEIKYDGYRTLIVADGRQVRAFTRNGNDWTSKGKFGEVWVGQKGGTSRHSIQRVAALPVPRWDSSSSPSAIQAEAAVVQQPRRTLSPISSR